MEQKNETARAVEALLQKWIGKRGNLIMALHEVQNHFGYVPREAAFVISSVLDVPLARIYEVITFYHYFKLKPPGKHRISVCMGTACYLKGAPKVLDEIHTILGIREGETTGDGLFQLQSVRCLGCCGLAPVMTIDDRVYAKVTKDQIPGILSEYTKQVRKA